jgi:hypothetical protein
VSNCAAGRDGLVSHTGRPFARISVPIFSTSSEGDTVHISSPSPLDINKNALRVDVNLVTVPVTVTDDMGHTVTGLRREDFALYEGEAKQDIRYFTEEDGPISVGLILDLSKSMANKVETERAAVEEFFQNANPDDDYFVIAVSNRPKLIASSTRSIRAIETELGLAVPGCPVCRIYRKDLMTRSAVLKLAADGHGSQRACAAHDLLVQRSISQCIRGEVIHVLARGNFIAELLHLNRTHCWSD